MKREAIKEYMIYNGEFLRVEEEKIFSKIIDPPIYEVIRVIDGVALFLEEHLDRLYESAKIIGYNIKADSLELINDINRLIEKNDIDNLNIKILISEIDGLETIIIYFIESFYPPEEYYLNGIHTTLYHYERNNPNAKVLYSNYKEDIKDLLSDKNAFEAILVSKDDTISEGSRSNMFFIIDDLVYTAKGEDVLLGITRKHIVDICLENNINLIEESISIDDLKKINGAIMTGTSVNALPIDTIDTYRISTVNNLIYQKINSLYREKIKKYIEKKKKM